MTFNPELLEKAVAWAEYEAQKPGHGQWDQTEYVTHAEQTAKRIAEAEFEDELSNAYFTHGWGSPQYNEVSAKITKRAEELQNFCGTSFCIAGYIAHLDKKVHAMPCGDFHGYARDRLGITDRQAEALFDGDNTIEDVRYNAEWIKEEHASE